MTLPAYTGTLTPAHRQHITAVGEQWAATVLSTAPIDRSAAAGAVRRLYDTHKLPQPRLTIWMDSPLGLTRVRTRPATAGAQSTR